MRARRHAFGNQAAQTAHWRPCRWADSWCGRGRACAAVLPQKLAHSCLDFVTRDALVWIETCHQRHVYAQRLSYSLRQRRDQSGRIATGAVCASSTGAASCAAARRRTSRSRICPRDPVGVACRQSTPSSAASRLAAGVDARPAYAPDSESLV